MAVYFLSYDLSVKGDYQKLYDELNKFKAVQVLEYVYAIRFEEKKSKDLRDYFKKFIDSGDGLLVIEQKDCAESHVKNTPTSLY